MSSEKIKFQIDPADKILLKRSLNKNGTAQKYFTHEVRRLSDPYVPLLNGPLKNTAIEQTDKITYPQPYSRKNYWENRGKGLRGKQWDKRMWTSRGPDIVRAVANYVGGKAKW